MDCWRCGAKGTVTETTEDKGDVVHVTVTCSRCGLLSVHVIRKATEK